MGQFRRIRLRQKKADNIFIESKIDFGRFYSICVLPSPSRGGCRRLSHILPGNESSSLYGKPANVSSDVLEEISEIFDDEESSASSILPGENILYYSLLGIEHRGSSRRTAMEDGAATNICVINQALSPKSFSRSYMQIRGPAMDLLRFEMFEWLNEVGRKTELQQTQQPI